MQTSTDSPAPANIRRRYALLQGQLCGGYQDHAVAAHLAKLETRYPALRNPTAGASTWRAAATMLIEACTEAGSCFTAGEIAATLRTDRPDLRFEVRSLIAYVEAQHVHYADGPAEIVTRYTTGRSRSPIGSAVRVFAPTIADALDYDGFEVDIPNPVRPRVRLRAHYVLLRRRTIASRAADD